MKKRYVELTVGVFVLVGLYCLAHLSVRLARMDLATGDQYEIKALFVNVGGLRVGASVVIAGVEVGRVREVRLEDYEGLVVMAIDPEVVLQKDSIASIRTRGLIGEKYVSISPGGSEEKIENGGEIFETEPAVDLEKLISNFVFGKM
jgi:phospholipid/cholesterol/gamma-HCH transport system substrate-binding protein